MKSNNKIYFTIISLGIFMLVILLAPAPLEAAVLPFQRSFQAKAALSALNFLRYQEGESSLLG